MIDGVSVMLLAQKELRDAIRNRWFMLYAAGFIALTLALSWISLAGSSGYGVSGFSRTTAGMVNLVLLIVPLMGLTLGALAVAGERERGELAAMLAQPVSLLELLLGKYIGLSLALVAALSIGFGLSSLVIVSQSRAGSVDSYLLMAGITAMLALGSLSAGFLLSAGLGRGATALGAALLLWLTFAFLSDLGLMGMALTGSLGTAGLFTAAVINPLQVFKIAVILGIRDNLEVLGPAGAFAVRTYGDALLPLLLVILSAWIVLPLGVAYPLARRRGAI